MVAQELWRRAALRGDEIPERLFFWQSKNHEIDFIVTENRFIEVKRGRTSPVEFSWFPKSFAKEQLAVINEAEFQTDQIQGLSMEDFLLH